jgi:hypothetical protein
MGDFHAGKRTEGKAMQAENLFHQVIFSFATPADVNAPLSGTLFHLLEDSRLMSGDLNPYSASRAFQTLDK